MLFYRLSKIGSYLPNLIFTISVWSNNLIVPLVSFISVQRKAHQFLNTRILFVKTWILNLGLDQKKKLQSGGCPFKKAWV